MANIYGTLSSDGHASISQLGDVDLVAQDPSDIVVTFTTADSNEISFPVKALKVRKQVKVTPIYGTGSLLAQQVRYSQIQYNGAFTVNTWLSKSDKLKLDKLLFDSSQGIPRYFRITVFDRSSPAPSSGATGNAIVQLVGCMCTEAGINIGEPGSVIATEYSFTAMRRNPP